MITMKENMCGSVNTRCLQSIASKCSVYQTNFNFFDQTKILSTSCSRHAQSFRKDRNCFGGGVLVYVSTTLKVKRRVDLEYDNHEFIWLQLDFSNKSVLICIVYRTQGAINPFWRDFQHSIEQSFKSKTAS